MIATTFDGREKLKGQNNPRTNMGLVYEFELNRFWRDLKKTSFFPVPLTDKNGQTDRQPDKFQKKKVAQDILWTNTDIVCEFQLSRYSSF